MSFLVTEMLACRLLLIAAKRTEGEFTANSKSQSSN